MKRHVMLLTLVSVLGILVAGCGPSPERPEPEDAVSAPEALPDEETSSQEDPAVEQFARNCKTTCTGQTSSGGSCFVVGFGSTTFLGGCRKACRFARGDADAKATASGCHLAACSDHCT